MNQFYFHQKAASLRSKLGTLLLFLLLAQVVSAQVTPATFPNGIYYIRKAGTELYYTRTETYTNNAALTFQVANANRDLQKWRFTYDTDKSRYKIEPAPVNGIDPGGLIKESGVIVTSSVAYAPTWHTYNIYYNEGSRSYAIHTAESPGISQWSISTAVSNPPVLGYVSSTNGNMRDVNTPLHYLFDLIPVSSLTEQTITFPAIGLKKMGDADFDPGATSTSGLSVTYSSSNTNVATIVDGKVHLVAPGITTIVASQAGNATFAAQYSSQTIGVKAASNGLVAWYKFEDNLNDASGANLMAYTPAKTWAGATGTVEYVTGKTENKAVRIAGGPAFVALPPGVFGLYDNFTINTWVKRETNTNWQRVFDFGHNSTAYAFLSANVGAATQKLKFGIKNNNGTEQWTQTADVALIPADGATWVNVAVVFSANDEAGTSYSVKIYVDGVQKNLEAGNTSNGTNFTIKPTAIGITAQNLLGKAQFAGDTYYVGAFDDFRVYNYALSAAELGGVLPVELISFNAEATAAGAVVLKWKTATEKNNSAFILERSTDARNFEKVATLASKAETGSGYVFTDLSPEEGVNYYRLSQKDHSGEVRLLGIQSVDLSLKKESGLSVFPNPNTGNQLSFNYSDDSAKDVSVKVMALDGSVVLDQQLPKNSSGTYSVTVNKAFAPGIYILSVNGASIKVLQR